MRTNFAIALISMVTISSAMADDFASLRQSVSKMLADSCDCSAISENPHRGRSFVVKAKDGQGFDILVREKKYLTQKEWSAKEKQLEALIKKVGNNISPEEIHATANLLAELPEFSYKHIGLDISIEDPDAASPDHIKNRQIAKQRFERIRSLLTPYEYHVPEP